MNYSFLIKPMVYIAALIFSVFIMKKINKDENCNCQKQETNIIKEEQEKPTSENKSKNLITN